MPTIYFFVTNDLSYDQRMQRICHSLANAGYNVTLVGRKLPSSLPLPQFSFSTKRLPCLFKKGMLFYVEYNVRLFFYLLFVRTDAFCAIDLDTILPVYFAASIRNKTKVYDAHELFTEQKEIVTRKNIHKFWLAIEKFTVPKFEKGYTVNTFIQAEFYRRYQVNYNIVRNLPVRKDLIQSNKFDVPTIIYQGAVNEGRSFETLIPAMKQVNAQLLICGTGNFIEQAKQLTQYHQLNDKVIFKGSVQPAELQIITTKAHIGVTLFEKTGLNQYYSLANRFFDYFMAGIPQVCVDYPEYRAINEYWNFALLIDNTSEQSIAEALNKLLSNAVLYTTLQKNALIAKEQLNWQEEEKKLVQFWHNTFIN